MNRLFVNIKVDREERPDLDRVYQLAHQVLTQRGGGWPLTLFLSPADLTPFFAGTYFPRTTRYGSPAFQEVLQRVAAFYHEHQDELQKQNVALQDVFKRIQQDTAGSADELDDTPLAAAYHVLAENFDAQFGGFGRAPKFPHPASLEFLLWQSCDPKAGDETKKHAREMLTTTLTRMAEGGIYDQLGGGFSRYSVDERWMVPHFEKMLYDNGPLLALYAQTGDLTNDPLYSATAHGIAAWVMHEMQAPEGGYRSSLDADSEGHEGKYYVWDRDEVRALLDYAEFAAFASRYGLDQPANFEGSWHLHVNAGIDEIAAALGKPTTDITALLDSARAKLLAVRQQRVRPGLDDKVLVSWNGLMIRGMAVAGRLLDEPRYLASAQHAVNFIQKHLWNNSRLFASWRTGQAKLPAYLDDYAFLLDGMLELLQAHWNSELFQSANELADALLANFEDKEHGGFWFTANDQPVPLHRSRTFTDDALPAGNAVAARALLTLGHLNAEPRYLDAAERTLKAAMSGMNNYPDAHAAMLLALQDALEPPTMIILRGNENNTREWRTALDRKFDPRRIALAIPTDTENLTGLLKQCIPRGDICAYICRGTECSLPITELDQLPDPVV
ncbi:MAG: thioredoxin domain-containing protein, partial [Gammaproteobacteria bacterium]